MIYNVNFKAAPQLYNIQRLNSAPRSTGLTKLELEQWADRIKMLENKVVEDLDSSIKRLPVIVGGKESGMTVGQMIRAHLDAMKSHLAALRGNPSNQDSLYSLTKLNELITRTVEK